MLLYRLIGNFEDAGNLTIESLQESYSLAICNEN